MNGMPVPIGTLPPGTRARCPWNGNVVEVLDQTLTGTMVKVSKPGKRFTTGDGEEVRIPKTTERLTWAPTARVIPEGSS